MSEPRQLELTQTLVNMGIAEIQKTVDSDNNPILIIIPTRNQSTNNHDYETIQFKIGETPFETTKSCESACGDYLDPNRISALGKFFTDRWEQIEIKSESNSEPEPFKSKYQLQLDDYLIKAGIIDMRRIGSNLVIIAKLPDDDPERDSRRISIKIGENETPEDFAEAIEIKCDKPFGRLLTQYIIQFVSKPENWNIINPSEKMKSMHSNQNTNFQHLKNGSYRSNRVIITCIKSSTTTWPQHGQHLNSSYLSRQSCISKK